MSLSSGTQTGSTWRALLATAEQALGASMHARRIIERASGYDGAGLAGHLDDDAPARAIPFVADMVARRSRGEPLQYVLGRWGFRNLDLLVDRRVLIPRPETETVVEIALRELSGFGDSRSDGPLGPGPVAVDLGTGSGAIALSIALESPRAQVWATDASPEALAVARANLAGAGTLVARRVRLGEGTWFDALPPELEGNIDLIVSNPPYVAEGETLPPEVADWEPTEALMAGPTGLEAVAAIAAAAPRWLARPGVLVVELPSLRAAEAAAIARRAGVADVEVHPDLTGRPRVLVGRVERASDGKETESW